MLRRTLRAQDAGWLAPLGVADVDLGHAVFCSRFRRDQHVAAGLPVGVSTVIYNGIDLDRFQGEPGEARSGPLRLLFVGRLVREKGLHTVIEALTHLRERGLSEVRLTVLGVPAHPFTYAAELRERVAAAGLADAVSFGEPLPYEAMPAAYRDHDALVFPSSGDEGLPMALVEAMACALPVVTTLTGGSPEVVGDGDTPCALTFAAEDAAGLADRIARLAAEPELRRHLASAGQARARERFGIGRALRETVLFLEEAARQRQAP
jgi:glycosyltransferase involved in cell wall biosynthesis